MPSRDAFPHLTFTLEHEGPIPLADFTDALTRMSSRYGRFTRTRGKEESAKLFIAQIREGSIEIDLVSSGVAAMAVLEGFGGPAPLIDFGQNVASLLLGLRDGVMGPDEVSAADCDDARALVAPALNSEGGGLSISASTPDAQFKPILISLDRRDAAVIDNRAAVLRQELAAEDEQTLREVFFVWDQIRDAPGVDQGKRSPDRGIIAVVDGRARQVTFADPAAKDTMYHGLNPFEVGFIVDAKIMVGPNGPAGYRILHVHEVVEREPPA